MEEKLNDKQGVNMESSPEVPKEVLHSVNENTTKTPQEKQQDEPINKLVENTLSNIADFILFFGIIATIACAFTLIYVETGHYFTSKEFSPTGLGITLVVFISTLISWSVMKTLANISISLKEINSKIKK